MGLALALALALGTCSSNRWISNRFGAFVIRDVTNDGYDDYVGWFVDFGAMIRTRLTVIDGRTGKYHFSCLGNSSRLASLHGSMLVVGADSYSNKQLQYGPEIGLYDLATGRVIRSHAVPVSVSSLCATDKEVVAQAGGQYLEINEGDGTIQALAAGPSECVNPGVIEDTSLLPAVEASAWPPAVASLALANVRSRAMPDGSFVWVGTATENNRLTVARTLDGRVVWSRGLGKASASGTNYAAGNSVAWFVPYADAGAARVAALDAATGNSLWDTEIAQPANSQAWQVCAMSAGTSIVGLAHSRNNPCDELLLLDASSGRLAFRYKRD